MAFWNINSNFSMVSATEKAMDRENFTLQDLLDTEDILKEVLVPNTRVIDYLCQPQIISELVDYAIAPEPTKPESSDSNGPDNADDVGTQAGADGKNDRPTPQQGSAQRGRKRTDRDSPKSDGETKFQRDVESTTSYHDHTEYDISEDSLQLSGSDNESSDTDQDFEEERLRRVRYAKLSAEILTTDVWTLLDALLSNSEAMHSLWNLLEDDRPLASTQQLSMLTKIVESLLEKRLDGMLDFIRTLPHFVDYFIRYIECQPLVDFLIKVISTDHPDNPTDIIELLCEQQLIPKMIGVLAPTVSHSAQIAAGDFLKAFVNISGGNKSDVCAIGPNELSRQFVSEECISELIRLMLHGGHGMCVAVTVIIEIIRKNNSDYDLVEVMQTTFESHPPHPRDNIYLGTMVKLFSRAIPEFQAMLTAPETRTMQMPFGSVKPLGFERFRICELYAELLHCSNMNLLNDPQGEKVIAERDERRRAVYGNRTAPNQPANAAQTSSGNKDASDASRASEHDSDMPEETHSSSESESGDEDASPSAYAPNMSPPMSPSESRGDSGGASSPATSPALPERHEPQAEANSDEIDEEERDENDGEVVQSPLMSPSPPTPDDDSGEELEYVDGDRPKINVSNLRSQELEDALETERQHLRDDPVVGDQLKIALDDNGCITAVLRMLFEFPWNNFLHNVVFDIVQQVFNGHIDHGYNKFLAIHMFTHDHITERIVEGQRTNDEHEQERHIRLGYVGHLTLISEEVVKFESVFEPESVSPQIAIALHDAAWIEYVHNDLLRLREQYNTVLGKVGMVGEDDDIYDGQEQERQRVLDMEIDVVEPERAGTARTRTNSKDRDDTSDSDSDSDSEDEVVSEVIDSDGDDNDEDHTITPQTTRVNRSADSSSKENQEANDGYTKESSQFSRYLSHQLSDTAGHFETGFSDEDDDSNEAWVPVPEDTEKQE